MSSALKLVSSSKCFDGYQNVYSHSSSVVGCDMNFGVYFPPGAYTPPNTSGDQQLSNEKRYPVIYFLSGLTCTEQNFIIKSGFQRYASQLGLIVINPDTSPRGCNVPGEDDAWDFGTGAGFYVDAKTPGYNRHYRMYSYILQELIPLVEREFADRISSGSRAITGHSMGGHGALVFALRNPGMFRSVGAFAPISNPVDCPWGQKCLRGYLGDENRSEWDNYDSTLLVAKYNGPELHIRIDQGSEDKYLKDELKVDHFIDAAKAAGVKVDYYLHPGYDHSYQFVGSFLEPHFKYLLQYL